jgi:hypothetical protein
MSHSSPCSHSGSTAFGLSLEEVNLTELKHVALPSLSIAHYALFIVHFGPMPNAQAAARLPGGTKVRRVRRRLLEECLYFSLKAGGHVAFLAAVSKELSESQRQTMAETGEALYRIREKRLYRETHASFEDYVRERWKVPMEWVDIAIEFYLAKRN